MQYLLRTNWWKWVSVVLLTYVVVAGLLMPTPRLPILNETIRVLHFHVPMWFGMLFLFLGSMVYSIIYLYTGEVKDDLISKDLSSIGVLFGIFGMLTGMFWATFTWGEPWSSDPKQNASAIALLVYFAYFILRGSIQDEQQRARISAVYNIFAFAVIIPLLFILPRLTDSLHPGNGGNPGLSASDQDDRLKLIFYPAVIGWTILGYWIATIRFKISNLNEKLND
jgi:heme exporter protein C